MPASREFFESKDGRRYPLRADIHDLMREIMPVYWADDREARLERGTMFRGQANADWDLIPSLYRPPADERIVQARWEYTQAFLGALRADASGLGLGNLQPTQEGRGRKRR